MNKKLHYYLLAFVFGLYLCLVGIPLFSQGMFSDGIIYAAIAHNMANGMGSFWAPKLTETYDAFFHGHPPLALGLQALFFKVFGSSYLVERFYGFLTAISCGVLIIQIWRKLGANRETSWLPLLLLLSTSSATWAFANNMLENTMMIFLLLSFLLYLKSISKPFWIVLSGLAIALAFLSKGVFALFLWSVPGLHWIVFRKGSFWSATFKTLLLMVSSIAPIALLYFFNASARHLLESYFSAQLFSSVSNVQTVGNRYEILWFFITENLIPVGIVLAFLLLLYRRNTPLKSSNYKLSIFLFSIGLTGILPIMVSLKQSPYYILGALPFISMGLALIIENNFKKLLENFSLRLSRVIKIIGVSVSLLGSILCIYFSGKILRDHDQIHDAKTIIAVTSKHPKIWIENELFSFWSFRGYLVRYGHATLENQRVNPIEYKYYMKYRTSDIQPPKGFEKQDLDLQLVDFYERKE